MGVVVMANLVVQTVSFQKNRNSSQKYGNYSHPKSCFCTSNTIWGKRQRLTQAFVVTHHYIVDCNNFSEAVMILLSFPCYEEVFGSGPSLQLD